jgi:uncharacterized integral membrane protein (TIGR00698 family)
VSSTRLVARHRRVAPQDAAPPLRPVHRATGSGGSFTGPFTAPPPGVVLGLAVALGGALVGLAVHEHVGTLSAHVVAVVLGVVVGNTALGVRAYPGFRIAGRHLLRFGIVLLGLRISVGDVAALGPALLLVVVAVVVATFLGTRALGRLLGLSPGFSLLVATGWSICGASAIAAAEPLARADEEEVAYAVAMVALCGSLAIVVLPAIGTLLGLSDPVFGAWVGASVHDVGQVVAAASTHGDEALAAAVVVKLTRVAMLAPLLASVAVAARRRPIVTEPSEGAVQQHEPVRRPPLVPWFVVAFLGAVALRSTGVLGDDVLDTARVAETTLVAAGLVGLGGQVVWRRLRRLGGRPLVLGLASWCLVAAVSLAGVSVVM